MDSRWLLIGILSGWLLVAPAQAVAQHRDDPSPPPSAPAVVPSAAVPYQPITGAGRVKWFAVSSFGPQSLAAGVFTAGTGTARNEPEEYGSSWEGFGKRYGMRFTGVITGNAMEAGLGSLWGEDPRYFLATGKPIKQRIWNIAIMTVAAKRRDGHLAPAYARYMAVPGNNFLSNAWRADSASTVDAALVRTGLGFVGKLTSNAFKEFTPELKRYVFRMK